jgi:drug/metabolite transporter (DMT)-like permease
MIARGELIGVAVLIVVGVVFVVLAPGAQRYTRPSGLSETSRPAAGVKGA